MPSCVGKCPVPWNNIMSNFSCLDIPDIPEDLVRYRCHPQVRLACIPTKRTVQKDNCPKNPCAPKDALDIALSACYDHHRQFWAAKPQTVMQCATYKLFPWGRAQLRACRLRSLPDSSAGECTSSTQGFQVVNHEQRNIDPSYMKCSIASPHISNTNRGYSRSSSDGVLYNS